MTSLIWFKPFKWMNSLTTIQIRLKSCEKFYPLMRLWFLAKIIGFKSTKSMNSLIALLIRSNSNETSRVFVRRKVVYIITSPSKYSLSKGGKAAPARERVWWSSRIMRERWGISSFLMITKKIGNTAKWVIKYAVYGFLRIKTTLMKLSIRNKTFSLGRIINKEILRRIRLIIKDSWVIVVPWMKKKT